MTAILYTLLFVMGGAAIIRMQLPGKSPLMRAFLGLALGILLEMQLPALCANLFDFTLKAHYVAAVLMLALVGVSVLLRDPHEAKKMTYADRKLLGAIALVALPLTVLSGYLQYTHMIMEAADGSYWCGQSTYGDLCMHLSFITSMQNMTFPPTYNLLYDTALNYPYLADSLSTTMLMLGMDIQMAVVFPGTLLMGMTYVGYMLLAHQVLGGRHKAVAAAALLFFFNGGLGFIYDFDMMGRDNFQKISEIFTGYYKTPANQPDLNLRFSNVIADLLVPQRALMGGWAMGIPALMLLISSMRERSMRQTLLLALWASCLPLVHTHTFLALGLFSGGYVIGRLAVDWQDWKGTIKRAGVYLAIVAALALPQLLGSAVEQTLEGGSLRMQFNWVNNSGGRGMIDGYFWFWIKNAGLPFILMILAVLESHRRGYLDIVLGMVGIFVIAETILFQPNEYDNNKLFYIWYMFAVILAADYGSIIMQRLKGLRGRYVLCALFMTVSMLSGGLSIAREAISGYQLFSRTAVEAGKWIEKNTDKDDIFMTGQQHINPVCSLAGRQIICGSDLYVFFHGLDYREHANNCQRFYEFPAQHSYIPDMYGVDYIYVSDYERAEFAVDLEYIDEHYDLVYQNPDVRIYATGIDES